MKKLISALILIMSSHSFATPKCSIDIRADFLINNWVILVDDIFPIKKFGKMDYQDMIDYRDELVRKNYCEFDAPSFECSLKIYPGLFPPFGVLLGTRYITAFKDYDEAFKLKNHLIHNRICKDKEE